MLGLFFYELFVKDNMSEEKYRNLKEKYGIEVSEETRGGIQTMCNLGEGILRKGINQGISQGLIQEQLNLLQESCNQRILIMHKLLDI